MCIGLNPQGLPEFMALSLPVHLLYTPISARVHLWYTPKNCFRAGTDATFASPEGASHPVYHY
jgi:hypothetical protein